MGSEPEGRKDGGATDVRGVRLCACSRSTRFKKLRVCTTAIRLEDSAAESVLFARRWSAMRHTVCIAPRDVECARLRGADGRRKAREEAFSMVCTALILLVVCARHMLN